MLIDLPSHKTDIKPVWTTKDLTTHIQNRPDWNAKTGPLVSVLSSFSPFAVPGLNLQTLNKRAGNKFRIITAMHLNAPLSQVVSCFKLIGVILENH